MSVIINEFEVVVDDRTKAPDASGEIRPDPAAPPPPPSPNDIRDLFHHQAERILRLWAH